MSRGREVVEDLERQPPDGQARNARQGPQDAPVLLYDGTCGLCASSIRSILRHDGRGTLRFAALQGTFGAAVRRRHPELDEIDSMVWVEPATLTQRERVFVRSTAALRVARYLGGRWYVALVAALLPRRLRDAAYDLVARHRHRLAPAVTCDVPAIGVGARFLD